MKYSKYFYLQGMCQGWTETTLWSTVTPLHNGIRSDQKFLMNWNIYQIFLTAFIIYFVNDLHSYQNDMSILFCQCSHFTYFLTDFTFYSVYKPVVIFSYQQDFFTSANSHTKYKTNEYIFKWYGSWIGKNLTFVV